MMPDNAVVIPFTIPDRRDSDRASLQALMVLVI